MTPTRCPYCGYHIGEYEAGKEVTCPHCKRLFVVCVTTKPKRKLPGPSEVKEKHHGA
jgi:hypothetical protein